MIDTGGSLNVTGAKLVINKPGQTWGGTTGGVLISDGAAMTASNGYLVITGSNGQGVMALNNSHATMIGATVTGGSHGGLVAANLSSIDVSAGTTLSLVSGNSVDLFCDPGSTITGSVNCRGLPPRSARICSAQRLWPCLSVRRIKPMGMRRGASKMHGQYLEMICKYAQDDAANRRDVVRNAIPVVGILCLILCGALPAHAGTSEELQFQIDPHWKQANGAGNVDT